VIGIDPELVAAELLATANVARAPVDLGVLFARWPQLRVSLADLDGAGYLLDLGTQGGELLLRRSDSTPRRRYTCAHELGHWVLRTNGDAVPAGVHHATVERWCDRFAAALLMPATWVIDLLGASPHIATIARLHQQFGVSRQAALLRVGELAPLELALTTRATSGPPGPVLSWSTAGRSEGRFQWVSQDWLQEQLQTAADSVQMSTAGIEMQATRLSNDRWLVALGSTAAVEEWGSRHGGGASEFARSINSY
jgi:hypothetical protein